MRGLKLALAGLLISFNAFSDTPIQVLDGSCNSPVEGATVISDRGLILGITDRNGEIYVNKNKDFPLTVRSVGYDPLTVSMITDTILLHPAIYELSEVTVKADERPIRKITSYAREFCSGASPSDTMQLYAEYMLVSYFDDQNKKIKGFKGSDRAKHPRAVKRIARFSNSEGLDSISSPDDSDVVSSLSFYNFLVSIPYKDLPLREKIQSGSRTDSVMGKYSSYAQYKKTDRNYIVSYDKLADYENHMMSPMIFKIFGMTMDIDRMQSTFIYQNTSDSVYTTEDFIYNSGTIHALAKGKMFGLIFGKKDVEIDCYAEIYPVDIEYLSVEEYKEDRKDLKIKEEMPFQTPKNLQPLPPAIERLVERVNKE